MDIVNEKEQQAYDAIVDAMNAVRDLDERGPLVYNVDELCHAVHTLQMFVHQHVLYRLQPSHYSDWWDDDEPVVTG